MDAPVQRIPDGAIVAAGNPMKQPPDLLVLVRYAFHVETFLLAWTVGARVRARAAGGRLHMFARGRA